jgi:hypothetical protein
MRRALIGCEYSGVVREAFRRAGWDAWSCDLLPTEIPGQHYQMDLMKAVGLGTWDLGIFHPPCTRVCNSGVLRLYIGGKKENGIDPVKWKEMEEGAEFIKTILGFDIPNIGVENPVPHGYAMDIIGQKYSQTIQPYEFGEDASKRTCLWLKGLPLLKGTSYFPPRYVDGKPRWGNQTDGGQNKLPPSATRGKDRAKTYQGIADAMAAQWS